MSNGEKALNHIVPGASSVKAQSNSSAICPHNQKVNVRKAIGVSENIANKTAFTYKEPQQTIQNNTGHVRRSQKN